MTGEKSSKSVDALQVTPTGDGWQVTLRAYLPPQSPFAKPPALLVHGFGSNYRIFDLATGHGLAPYLKEKGMAVFTLDLRGRGASRPLRWTNRYMPGWNVDDFIERDLPAAINKVQELSGHQKINYLGHSLGGVIVYAYLIRSGGQALGRVVTVGSPGTLPMGLTRRQQAAVHLTSKLTYLTPILPTGSLVSLLSPLMMMFPRQTVRLMGNYRNIRRRDLKDLLAHGLKNISARKIRHYLKYLERQAVVSADGSQNYSERLSTLTNPILFLAGGQDAMIPPWVVQEVFELCGSREKKMLTLSRNHGFSTDYGHVDMLIGKKAQDEVYPKIWEWLTQPT